MKDLKYYEVNNKIQNESSYLNRNYSQYHNIKNISVVTHDKIIKTRNKLKNNTRNYTPQPSIIFHLSNFGSSKNRKHITRLVSMPEITRGNRSKKKSRRRIQSSSEIQSRKNKICYGTKYVVSERRFKCSSNHFNFTKQTNFKVYRCQVAPGVAEDCHKCCCSCNSDVLFEVMKDLYDCYKGRDCENCNCILCCNLPEHEREGLAKKSTPSIGLEAALKQLAMKGFPLPEGKTGSEKMLIDKIRYNLGLPPEPKNDAMRSKYTNAANAGLMLPLAKKTPPEKEKILQGLANMGIPLPEGRTPSEKALIAKIKGGTGTPLSTSVSLSEKMRKAKSAGLLTPLEGKSPDKIEKILRGLAMKGIPLPKGKTPSKKKLIAKVRGDLGLPPEPKTSEMLDKHKKAARVGFLLPLEGKSPSQKEKILHGLNNMGIPLPVGRTPSERSLIAKVKAQSKVPPITSSEKLKERKSPVPVPKGVYTPLEGKTPAQREAILKELAMKGIPLPDGRTESEKKLIKKIRYDLGLPPDPKTPSMKAKHAKAAEAGVLLPLEGKPSKGKEKILRGLADMRIPLPKGRTPSEKALISKVKLETREPLISPEKMRKAKAAGFLTPLEGKTPEQKEKILRGLAMHGIPLPEGKTKSEKDLINKIRLQLGLPPEPKTPSMKEKHAKAADAGILLPLEGKSPKEKEKILRGYLESGIPLPEGRTPSEKALIAKVKTRGPVLPPTGMSEERLRKAKAAGLLTPLAGKPPEEKERILRNLAKAGLPLPLAKSPSEIVLINKIKKEFGIVEDTPEEKIRKAKAAGYLTPLEGKPLEQRETILRGRAAAGLPLPVGTTPSERELIKKIKASTGYVTPSPSERLRKAEAAGLLTPLKGKTPSTKVRILKDMLAAGVPIPEGTTPSEKEIIKKVIAPQVTKSKKLKAAKAAGLLTPLAGKTNEQKEKILKGLAKMGLPLPMPNTPSERKLVDKVRADLGLPPEPKSRSLREKYERAHDAGIITPLEGKSPEDKEKLLRRLQSVGIPLPIGRTRSEKAMVKRIKAGLLASPKTPFDEMTPEEKEKRLKHLIKLGRPLPDAKSPSGKALVEKVRKDLGLPPAPKSESMKIKMNKAYADGLITPLEGKNELQKNKILARLAKAGIPLPEGRTSSEKAMIRKIQSKYKKRTPGAPVTLPSEMLLKAKDLGLLTPLAGKPHPEKERILRGLADQGIPLPEAITPSEKMLTEKVRKELGLPPEPITASMKERHNMAAAEGILVPLDGLNEPDKRKHLRDLANMGIPLPEGRTASEKILIDSVNAETNTEMGKLEPKITGIITPLLGKTPEEQEIILRGLAEAGLPMPKGETKSQRLLIRKIRAEYGIPSRATTASQKEKVRKAKAKGLFTPLAGKKTAEKERIVRGLAEAGLPLPEGKTATERDIIKRVKAEFKGKSVSEELTVSRKTCERACGCGTKKIKFKHSYVKISILSPDISNICPCPNECIPGVKGGIFAGSKGISVVIETAIGVPRYSSNYINTVPDYKELKANNTLSNTSNTAIKILFHKNRESYNFGKNIFERHNLRSGPGSDNINYIIDTPYYHTSVSDKCTNELASIYPYDKMPPNIVGTYSSQSSGIYNISSNETIASDSYRGSLLSILFVKSDTSLSFSSSCEIINTDSIILYVDDSSTSNINTLSDFDLSKDSIENLIFHLNEDEYYSGDTIARSSHNFTDQATLNDETNENNIIYNRKKQDDDCQVFQMSQRKQVNVPETHRNNKLITKTAQPVVVINQLNSEIDVSAVVDEILLNKEFGNTSSLLVIVPISDDEDDQVDHACHKDSANCYQLSNNYNKWICTDEEELNLNIVKQLQDTNIEQEINESKFMGLNPSTTSVSVCQIPPCLKVRRSCHFADSDQHQDAKPSLQKPLSEIKKLLAQQSPETIKELCNQIRAGKLKSKKDFGTSCVKEIPKNMPPAQISPRHSPPILMPPVQMPPVLMPPVQMPPDQMPPVQMPPIQMPPGFLPPAPENLTFPRRDEICPGCFKPKYKDGKAMKCACSGKKKKVRLRPLCPCEQHQWPMSKILYGPKPGTVSVGCQCCMCDDTPTTGPHGQIIPRLGETAPAIYGPPVSAGIQSGSGSIICPKGGLCRFGDGKPVIPQPVPLGFYGQPNLDWEMGQVDIYGPAGGYAYMGPGGTYTQAGIRQTRYSGGVGTDMGNVGASPAPGKKKNCACAEKKGKKKGKGNVICECPPEPEPPETPVTPPSPSSPMSLPHGELGVGPFPDLGGIDTDPQNLNYLEYYGDYLKNRIETHRKKMQAMKSDLTQTTSGFKFNKKKRPISPHSSSDDMDVNVEDAIRYYALTNPEMLRELLPPEIIHRAQEECVCEEAKSVNTDKISCECPEEPLTEEEKAAAVIAKRTSAGVAKTGAAGAALPGTAGAALPGAAGVPLPGAADPNLPEDALPKGFKIRMPGKGSGSKGLTGICCFDMIEER